jgi:hypothetical protein
MTKMKKEGMKLFIVALASFLMLVFCIVAASPDSTLQFIDPTPANYTQEQDFTCGVLAINTHKSCYLPNEAAFIGIAVLDNEGHMVCDADVTLTITDPGNNETVLSTSNGLINVSPQCCVYGVTNLPDFYTNYTVGGAGTYVMNLTVTAVTADGTKSITDVFTVQNSVDFEVARDGATRIYPSVPYVMKFTIKANKNYTGLIREYVPASFVITPQDGLVVTTVGDTDTKILTWNGNLVKGETYNMYYEFDAPDVSPYLFTLGALEIGSFKEDRQWQIASDATVIYYFDAYDSGPGGKRWHTDPGKMVDGTETSYASTANNGDVELLTGNTCPGTDLGTITKVEIRAYGCYTESSDNVILRPVFAGTTDGADYKPALTNDTGEWGTTFNITTDPKAPSSWTWSNVINLDCDVEYYKTGQPDRVYVGEVEIIVTYTPPTWESYKTDYPDQSPPGTQCDNFSNYAEEHQVYMYGVGFTSGESYKVVYWDADGSKRMVDTGVTVAADSKLRSTWTFAPDQATEGYWHVTVYLPSDYSPGSYSATDSHIVADDKSYTDATSFYVSESAIPEFPTVITGFAVCMLCAVAYVVMRRRAEKG